MLVQIDKTLVEAKQSRLTRTPYYRTVPRVLCYRPLARVLPLQHHCRHCGKVFCADCLTKTVNSGPNLRPSKVCDVCHTILVQDATPYFSTEPPATPD